MTDRLDPEWIARVTGGKLRRWSFQDVTGFSIDSRTIRPGEFFIALRGERTDGHLFLGEAFQRGASGALISRDLELGESFRNIIAVEDTRAALHQLARAYRQRFPVPVIGVTGSSGKTTAKELLFSILAQRFKAYRSPGNYNTEYGLPLAILGMPADVDVGIFELGLQRPGEVGWLAEILGPTVGIITGLGDAHLGFFRDREELAESKWELIGKLPQDGLAVINLDSPHLQKRMRGDSPSPLPSRQRDLMRNYPGSDDRDYAISFGIEGEADYRALSIDDTQLEGLWFTLKTPQGEFSVGSKLLGRFNVYNILAAAAAALRLGATPPDVQRAVGEFRPPRHRMELRRSPLGLIIDDSYNANPASTRAALTALANLRTRRRTIFVFGDMKELGKRAVEFHREIAEIIDGLGLNSVFTLGELAGETGEALLKRGWGDRIVAAEGMEELREALLSRLDDDQNLILVKGSRAMELDKLVELISQAVR